MMNFDVVVVGAGVAGCASALEFLSAGLRVAVLEREGEASWYESVSPEATRALSLLGVENDCDSVEVMAWWGSREPMHARYPGAQVTERAALAAALRKCAEERGAVAFKSPQLPRVRRIGKRWQLEDSITGVEFDAAYLIDATGRAAALGHHFGARRENVASLFAISANVSHPGVSGVWSESTSEGWWNFCGLSEQGTISFFSDAPGIREAKEDLAAHFDRTEHLQKLVKASQFSSFSVRPCGSSFLVPCAGEGWFAVGDAAWTVEPLASAGIAKAFPDGGLVRRFLDQRSSQFDHLQRRRFESYLKQLVKQYSIERRWMSARFWHRRFSGPGERRFGPNDGDIILRPAPESFPAKGTHPTAAPMP